MPLVSLNSRGALGEQNPSSVRAKQVLRPHHEGECIHVYGAGGNPSCENRLKEQLVKSRLAEKGS